MSQTSTDFPKITWNLFSQKSIDGKNRDGNFKLPHKISRFPIGSKEMRHFYEAPDGFKENRWWKDLAVASKRWDQENTITARHANNMNWYTAVDFSNWLSYRLTRKIRLPTEDELIQASPEIAITHLSEWCINEYENHDVAEVQSGLHKAVRGTFSYSTDERSFRKRNAGSPINANAFVGFRVVMES